MLRKISQTQMNMHGLTYNLNKSHTHTHRNREATRGQGLEIGKMLAKATSLPLLNEYFWKSVYKTVISEQHWITGLHA